MTGLIQCTGMVVLIAVAAILTLLVGIAISEAVEAIRSAHTHKDTLGYLLYKGTRGQTTQTRLEWRLEDLKDSINYTDAKLEDYTGKLVDHMERSDTNFVHLTEQQVDIKNQIDKLITCRYTIDQMAAHIDMQREVIADLNKRLNAIEEPGYQFRCVEVVNLKPLKPKRKKRK